MAHSGGWAAYYFLIMRARFSLLACVLFPWLLNAQSNLATINGTITDPSARIVAQAEVRVRSADTGALRTAVTGPAGQFEIPGLTPG